MKISAISQWDRQTNPKKNYDTTTTGRDERKHSRRPRGDGRGNRNRPYRHGNGDSSWSEPWCVYAGPSAWNSGHRIHRGDRVLRAVSSSSLSFFGASAKPTRMNLYYEFAVSRRDGRFQQNIAGYGRDFRLESMAVFLAGDQLRNRRFPASTLRLQTDPRGTGGAPAQD